MGIAIRVASPKLVMEEVGELFINVQHKTVYDLFQCTETAIFGIANRDYDYFLKSPQIHLSLSSLLFGG